MHRSFATNLLTLIVSATVVAGALEMFIRWQTPQASAYTGRGLFQPDDELGHVLRPGVERGDIRISAQGFRDREYAHRRPAGVFRIIGIGDSFTFGSSFPGGIYLEVLEQLFHDAGGPVPVEVINAGVPAYSTIQEIAHLRRFGLRFAPDLVVLGLFPTGDVIENHSDEHLRVVDGELSSRPVPRWERLLMRSHLFRFLRSRFVVCADSPPPGLGTTRFLAVEHDRLQTCSLQPPGHVRHGYAVTEGLLHDLQADLQRRGIGLVVLLIPDEVQVSPELFARVLANYGEPASAYDLELPQTRIGAALASAGIPAVDVLALCRERQRQQPVYVPEDTHWNAMGHAIAAHALEAKIESLYPRLRKGAQRHIRPGRVTETGRLAWQRPGA